MFTVRRKVAQTARRLGTRQYSAPHSTPNAHGAEHGHHAGPVDESFGRGFYVVLFSIPASIAVYTASRPSTDGKKAGFSRLIEQYSDYKERWTARNTLHTVMVEQAAFDRNVFQSTPGSAHIDLRFPEIFNTGSPYNVVAGSGARNMDALVAHYEKANVEESERKVKELAKKEAFFAERDAIREARKS